MNLPKNWHLQVLSFDAFQSPYLVPGHRDSSLSEIFSDLLTLKNEHSILGTLVFGAATLFLMAVLYPSVWMWRWSIKSTAWFYLPLIWVGRGCQDIKGNDLLVWAKTYSSLWLNVIGFLLASALLFVSLASLLSFGRLL